MKKVTVLAMVVMSAVCHGSGVNVRPNEQWQLQRQVDEIMDMLKEPKPNESALRGYDGNMELLTALAADPELTPREYSALASACPALLAVPFNQWTSGQRAFIRRIVEWRRWIVQDLKGGMTQRPADLDSEYEDWARLALQSIGLQDSLIPHLSDGATLILRATIQEPDSTAGPECQRDGPTIAMRGGVTDATRHGTLRELIAGTSRRINDAQDPTEVLEIFRAAIPTCRQLLPYRSHSGYCRVIYRQLGPEAQRHVLEAYNATGDPNNPEDDPITREEHPWNGTLVDITHHLRTVPQLHRAAGIATRETAESIRECLTSHGLPGYTSLHMLNIVYLQLHQSECEMLARTVIQASKRYIDIGIPPQDREEALRVARAIDQPTTVGGIMRKAANELHRIIIRRGADHPDKTLGDAERVIRDTASKLQCTPESVATTAREMIDQHGESTVETFDRDAKRAGHNLGFYAGKLLPMDPLVGIMRNQPPPGTMRLRPPPKPEIESDRKQIPSPAPAPPPDPQITGPPAPPMFGQDLYGQIGQMWWEAERIQRETQMAELDEAIAGIEEEARQGLAKELDQLAEAVRLSQQEALGDAD